MHSAVLETPRLIIRPFVSGDLLDVHRILCASFGEQARASDPAAVAERKSWLAWSMLAQEWLPRMHQPPYGDRAVVLKASGVVVGVTGYAPCLDLYDQIPELRDGRAGPSGCTTAEFGLFWAIDPAHWRNGYASEAARALVDHAFRVLRVRRIIATTEHANQASQGVMRSLGMTIGRNPQSDPPWLQVVAVLDNPAAAPGSLER
ncbi:MAG: GNAT family N-acetyltransferase [Chloroflexi bacterium]|nr:GNAT family N-acetyltransferase [Chloroflexota bacterium]